MSCGSKAFLYGFPCAIRGPQGPPFIASYGFFSSNVSQPVSNVNEPTIVSYNKTEANNNISINGNNEVVFHTTGVYQVVASPEFVSDANQAANCYVWFRKNSYDLSDSASKMTVASKSAPVFTSVPFILRVNAGDNIQTVFASEEDTVGLGAFSANVEGFAHPAVPSIILTINQIAV